MKNETLKTVKEKQDIKEYKSKGIGKRTSIYTTIVTFIFGILIYGSYFIIHKDIMDKEKGIGLGIFLLTLNAVTASVDISMIIGAIKKNSDNQK